MDHMMPEMDGLETAARIRAIGSTWYQTAPIVALSANAISGVRGLFLNSGMDDFLSKPIDAGELNRILAKWLPQKMTAGKDVPAGSGNAVSAAGKTERRSDEKAAGLLIDRAAGIINAVNNEKLYRQLLFDFKTSHGGNLQGIKAALEEGDYQLAHRLAHTVKSTSNLIGAKSLGAAALAVEKALKENAAAVITPVMWGTLEKEFGAVMAELEQLVPESAPDVQTTEKLDAARALALIQKLEPLLKSGSTGSLNLLDDIREIFAPLGEESGKLVSAIDDFEFAEASDLLGRIREKIAG
jgi:HPt (histidine-containing phosphotransfer) domain-containing protein